MPEQSCYACRMGRCCECQGLCCTHTPCGGRWKDDPLDREVLLEVSHGLEAQGSICTLLD